VRSDPGARASWLDLGDANYSPEEQRRRLRLFLAAYGSDPSEADVIAAAIEKQTNLIAEGTRTGNTAMSAGLRIAESGRSDT
jgi:hypothetical protein